MDCGLCIAACPEAAPLRGADGKVVKCDLCGGDPQCVKACARQSRETGEVLRCDPIHAGVHRSYRDVTPDDAVEGLIKSLYYPNTEGERK